MKRHSGQYGLSLIELIVILGLFGLVVFLGVVLLGNERAKTRDAGRLADMTRVQSAFQILYFEKASYAPAAEGCSAVGNDIASCGLERYLPGIGSLKDPGRFSYTIASVPDDGGYAVEFTLERAYGTLAAGKHRLTKAGIQ
jgi:type II secretory pathway pseudopilin PulG